MRHLSVALLAIALIAAPSFAQCSTLTVTGSVNAGQTVSIDLSGATANAVAVLAAGDTAGTTTFTFPGASVTIDLAQPFILFPLGMTDAAGHASACAARAGGAGPRDDRPDCRYGGRWTPH